MVKKALIKHSPLMPKKALNLHPIRDISLYVFTAELYNKSRDDIAIFIFPKNSSVAEVFTKSSLRSSTLDWNEKALKQKKISALFINSGNANTFTGKEGRKAIQKIIKKIEELFFVSSKNVFIASTGVIGEPFPIKDVINAISSTSVICKDWNKAAKAIMTTDTFPKGISVNSKVENKKIYITGISKGSGMVEPNMATILGFILTDIDLDSTMLNKLLKQNIDDTFNAISVDGDESTNDTVFLISSRSIKFKKKIKSINDTRLKDFKIKLKKVFKDLSEQIVRDGEGATKLIEVNVSKSRSKFEAKTIAKSIANSPLVKTAIHGSDPNWGRIIMAIGKTYFKINEKKLKIKFGRYLLTKNGKVNSSINEKNLKSYLKKSKVSINVDLALGKESAKVITCDFSKKYIDINASYKS